MSEKQQRLVYSIIEFLNQSIQDGTVKADDQEGLEVAIQCIGEAFGVDPSNKEQSQTLSVKPASLQSIFDVFIKTRDKISSEPQLRSSQSSGPSANDKVEAEKYKQAGNAQMSSKGYDAAIESYNKAVSLDSTNPVYYSNRAAAYSSKGDHLSAVGDAEKAISVDPKFVKAYHRLGYAQYSLGDFKASASAFERGLKIEPGNADLKSGFQNSQARIVSDDTSSANESSSAPGPNPAAGFGVDMMKNMGMRSVNMASVMNNPRFMAMVQQVAAANGGLDNVMRNPRFADKINRLRSGNTSVDELLADPDMLDMVPSFWANT